MLLLTYMPALLLISEQVTQFELTNTPSVFALLATYLAD
jgi:hypothetical protein